MPQAFLGTDTLDQENQKFDQKPLTKPVFINSIPKSGSHLLRNILRMFVPVEQQYKDQFIQWPNIAQHMAAFDTQKNYLVSAHLLYTDKSAMLANRTRKFTLIRDPYTWVMAQARFFVSDAFKSNFDNIKDGSLTVNDLLNLMIVGIYQKSPPMRDQYNLFAISWMGTGTYLVKYEELVLHANNLETDAAEKYFSNLLGAAGIIKPSDWRERVKIGADKKQSGTSRENINSQKSKFNFPDELPDIQKQLIEYHAPGLRKLLGYA